MTKGGRIAALWFPSPNSSRARRGEERVGVEASGPLRLRPLACRRGLSRIRASAVRENLLEAIRDCRDVEGAFGVGTGGLAELRPHLGPVTKMTGRFHECVGVSCGNTLSGGRPDNDPR